MSLNIFSLVFILNFDKRLKQGESLCNQVKILNGNPRLLIVGSGKTKNDYFRIDTIKPSNWKGNQQTYNYSMCWKKLLELAIDENLDNFLFLEDDANFVPCFEQSFVNLSNYIINTEWDMFYLGSNQIPDDKICGYKGLKTYEVYPNILRSARSRDMHAVAVNKTMYTPLLNIFQEKWLPDNPSFDEAVAHALHHKHKVFAACPSLVVQEPGYSFNKNEFDNRLHTW